MGKKSTTLKKRRSTGAKRATVGGDDFTDPPPASPVWSDKDDEVSDPSEVADDDEEEEDEEDLEDNDGDGSPPQPKPKRHKKQPTTDRAAATAIVKELGQFKSYEAPADRNSLLTTSTRNIAGIVMDKKFVVPVHSATYHVADPGEEEDDDHHNETVGHFGGSGVAVHIPQAAFGKKATLTGVDRDIIVKFYEDPMNHKKFFVMTDATDEQKLAYKDVVLFPFVPSIFLDWLLEKQRTPFEFYSYVLLFIRNIDDKTLKVACTEACNPLLQWCLCSCIKASANAAGPLTKLPTPITAIMSPTIGCSNSLAARLNATRGAAPHRQQQNNGGDNSATEAFKMAAAAAASSAATSAQMLALLQQQQQQPGKKSAADKDDSGWSDHLWEQVCGYCGVSDRSEAPPLLEDIIDAKDAKEAALMITKAMHEEADAMGVNMTPFHISESRVKDIRKGTFATGARATLADLKSGIVILDLVERTSSEIAALQSHEGEERQSERNRSLEESRAIALRQKQNVGAVPDNVPDAKTTLTNYVVFIRVLFGTKCSHYQSVYQAKQMVDAWSKESVTTEMIKNLFWAIIVDARQFFSSWVTPPTSKLGFIINAYEVGQYTPLITLPHAWRDGADGADGSRGGTSGVNRSEEETTRDRGRSTRRQGDLTASTKASVNDNVHPLIAELMKPYWDTFERCTLNKICSEAGIGVRELPKFQVKSKGESCVNFNLGFCSQAGRCTRYHHLKNEVKTEDAKKLCTLLKPGIEKMIANKEKFKSLGLRN